MYIRITYILFFLASAIEPAIWLYAFSAKLGRKYKSIWPYMAYVAVDYGTALFKQFANEKYQIGDLIFTVFMLAYVIFFISKLYNGKMIEKVMCTGMMFLASLIADFLSLGMFAGLGHSMTELSTFGVVNMTAAIVSKCFLFIIVNIVFKKNSKFNIEMAPIIFSTILMELPAVEKFNRISIAKNQENFLLYVFRQIGLFIVVGYVMHIIRQQSIKEDELRKSTRDMEMQLEGANVAKEVFENLRMLRHDMKFHIGTVKTLLKEKRYEETEKYLDKVYKDIDIAENYFTLKNRNVSITLDRLKQKATDMEVAFYTKIMTEEFVVDDVDICTILWNVVLNAIEAAGKSEQKYVKLIITNRDEGYQIDCKNSYKGRLSLKKGEYKSTKEKNRGLGIKIVRKAVEKHNGRASFIGYNGVFSVNIFIPGEKIC